MSCDGDLKFNPYGRTEGRFPLAIWMDNFAYAILNLIDAIILFLTMGFWSPADFIFKIQMWIQDKLTKEARS